MECPEQGELQRVIGRGEYPGGMSYLTRLLASTHVHPALIFRILPNAGDERTPDNSTQLNSTENYGRRCLTPLSPHRNYILS